MDVYKAPESDVSMEAKRPFRPIRGAFLWACCVHCIGDVFRQSCAAFFLELGHKY